VYIEAIWDTKGLFFNVLQNRYPEGAASPVQSFRFCLTHDKIKKTPALNLLSTD
jgi:hypothetical protein